MDTPIPRLEFARRIGRPVRTLDRWARRGCFGVVLPVVLVGDRTYYTLEAFKTWQAEVNAKRATARARDFRPVNARAEKRRLAEVDARLERRGMKV